MTETWLPVVGFDGYEVSDLGQVRSLPRVVSHSRKGTQRVAGRIMKQWQGSHGYWTVSLWREGVSHPGLLVHVLVLTAHVGAPPGGAEGCHGDRGPLDNALDNLRWDTHGGNMFDSVEGGTHNNARKTHCPRSHRLDPPNLVECVLPNRACRACALTHTAGYRVVDPQFKVQSDRRYQRIMGVAA